MEYKKVTLIQAISLILFAKILLTGCSLAECLGALILLSSFHLDRVLSHLFPKRVDVFKELSLVQEEIAKIQPRTAELERDVTALKMGGLVKR